MAKNSQNLIVEWIKMTRNVRGAESRYQSVRGACLRMVRHKSVIFMIPTGNSLQLLSVYFRRRKLNSKANTILSGIFFNTPWNVETETVHPHLKG